MDEKAKEGKKELDALLKRTSKEKPQPADIKQIQAVLEQVPTVAEKLGNLANQIELQMLDKAFQNDKGFVLILSKRMEIMRDDMGHKDASIIEKSLIEHVVICWLRLSLCELRYEANLQTGQSLVQSAHWEKTLSANQKRYLRAVETLYKVRRLMAPQPNPLTLALIKQQIGTTK